MDAVTIGEGPSPAPADPNPLIEPWDTPYGLPPFAAVRSRHFPPAFDVALRGHRAEIDAIGSNAAPPTFANTIAALDRSGRLLARIVGLFHNLTSSETSATLQAVEVEMAPQLAAHESATFMNRSLFARIDALHGGRP